MISYFFTRFKLLHEEAIEFNKFGLRDNVAQICVLEVCWSSIDLLQNMHLLFTEFYIIIFLNLIVIRNSQCLRKVQLHHLRQHGECCVYFTLVPPISYVNPLRFMILLQWRMKNVYVPAALKVIIGSSSVISMCFSILKGVRLSLGRY